MHGNVNVKYLHKWKWKWFYTYCVARVWFGFTQNLSQCHFFH